MKTFKNVAEWLKSNPSDEDQTKVLSLINKVAVQQIRREISKLNRYQKRLSFAQVQVRSLGLPESKEITEKVEDVIEQIMDLQKQIPTPVKREKKTEEV